MAYATYVTSNEYLCGALVNFQRLRLLNSRATYVIVLTSAFLKAAKGLLIERARKMDVVLREVESAPQAAGHGYYQDVLVKLRVFELKEYGRIIYFDSDGIFMNAPDALFSLPPALLYAPRAWWLGKESFTSMLMVIDPNACSVFHKRMWEMASSRKSMQFDMDILNAIYGKYITLLSPYYATLVAHWDGDRPTDQFFPDDMDSLIQRVSYVHFTMAKKPWSFPKPKAAAIDTLRRMKPRRHKHLEKILGTFLDLSERIC